MVCFKLIRSTLFFLFVSVFSFGQTQKLDFLSIAGGGSSTDADFQAWLDAVPDDPTSTEQAAINGFVIELKAQGLWTRMKTGNLMFVGSKSTAKINLKDPATYTLTEVNTVPFDLGRGISSDRYSSYMSQPFKSNEYAGIQTDLTVIQYIVDDNSAGDTNFSHGMRLTSAGGASIGLYPYYGSSEGYHYHGGSSHTFTSTNSKGLYVHTYNGTSAVIYKDGTKTSSSLTPTAPNIGINRYIGSYNNASTNNGNTPFNYSGRQIAADFLFDRFDDTDEANFRNAFNTYILPLIGADNRIENSSHCWFARNRAVYHSGSNKTFFGNVYGPNNANYSQYIFQLDHATGVVTNFRLGSQVQKDDHNEPSILIRASDSRLIAVYTEHSASVIRYRISTNPLDISSWGAEQTVDPNPGTTLYTYPSIFQVTNGDIYVFFRDAGVSGGATSNWSYMKSTNGGTSFGSAVVYSDYTYSNAAQDPTDANKIHFIVTEHPGDGDFPNTVGTFYFDASGATFHKTDGTNITAGIPLDATEVTILQSNNSPVQCWVEDIIVDATGKPRALFFLIPDETTSLTKDEYYTEWNGSAWTTPYKLHTASTHYMETDIPSALDIDSKWYAPLGSFDRGNPDRIFSSKEVSGVCEIHKLTRVSASNFTSEQLTFNSGYDQWRPFTTSAPNRNVFWLNKRYYDDWINLYCQDLKYGSY